VRVLTQRAFLRARLIFCLCSRSARRLQTFLHNQPRLPQGLAKCRSMRLRGLDVFVINESDNSQCDEGSDHRQEYQLADE
jgi:hypothetical protein